jgi:anti-anti-sigma factor
MQISQYQQGNVQVLALSGRVDELASPELDQTFGELIASGEQRVVVDMAGVEYISSSGLRVLLMLYKTMKQTNGHLKLSALSPFVTEVFNVTNYHTLFDVHPNAESAVAAMPAA